MQEHSKHIPTAMNSWSQLIRTVTQDYEVMTIEDTEDSVFSVVI
jgi:hypothetical protein